MIEPSPIRRRSFPLWTQIVIYALLAYGALETAGYMKQRRIQQRIGKARVLQAEAEKQATIQ
jgi:hypothetical protein